MAPGRAEVLRRQNGLRWCDQEAGVMDAETAGTFGELLRRYRAAAGLTQEELAARTGLTPQGISLLERGVRQRPQTYTVHKLADALGLAGADRARFTAAARGGEERGVARPG